MPSAIAAAYAELIATMDATHENLEMLDTLIHELLDQTAPKRNLDEDDCNCGKRKAAEGEARYS